MKLMDEVAGIVAARHCNTNIVTASVDAINFHRKIKKGEGHRQVIRKWRWTRVGSSLSLCTRSQVLLFVLCLPVSVLVIIIFWVILWLWCISILPLSGIIL